MQRLYKPLQLELFSQKFTTFDKEIQAAEAKELAYPMFPENTRAEPNHLLAFQTSITKKALKQFNNR